MSPFYTTENMFSVGIEVEHLLKMVNYIVFFKAKKSVRNFSLKSHSAFISSVGQTLQGNLKLKGFPFLLIQLYGIHVTRSQQLF